MSVITSKCLKYPAHLPGSATAQVTAATNKTTYVKLIILHNTDSTSTYQVVLYHYATGGSASASNEIWKANINPYETLIIELAGPGIVMAAGDVLSGYAGTADKVTIAIYGGEEA